MRKLVILSLILGLVLVLNVIAASAAVQVTDLTIGGANQDASNPEHDEDSKLVITATGTVTVTNTNAAGSGINETITAASFGTFLLGFASTDLNLQVVTGQLPVTIAPGVSATIQIQGTIPSNLDAVEDVDGDEKSFQVATGTLTSSASNTFKIFMQRKNQLEIQDINAKVNDLTSSNLDDGDDLKNIKPGDKITLEVNVENNFRDRENLAIEDVDVTLTCDDESSLEIDEDDEFDVGTNDEEVSTIELEIDDDADDDTLKCTVLALGTDENGATHGSVLDFDLKIERESHDIHIMNVDVNPSVLSCTDRSVQVTVNFNNLGKRDEDEVAIELESRTLSYIKKFSNIVLDQDDSQAETFDIPLPSVLEPGAHVLQIRTFYESNKASDSEIVQLDNACGQVTEQPTDGTVPVSSQALSLTTTTFATESGSAISVPVKVTNLASGFREFTVTVTNADEFAEPVSGKTLNLAAGQTSTVFLNMKVKDNVEAGKYSANVNLLSGSKPVSSETVSVDVAGEKAAGANVFGDTKIFWIIADVILVLVAIFFIRLIFRKKE
ncbi:MAG TPA: putative S-layer protein [Candidatus Nanoarchaeia archaeon]|nr:putative S-layer protein [Candidatus Nanoarchaeia archaeon]